VRYLTVREAARTQTFPYDYQLPDLRTVAMRALGNAVAVNARRRSGAG
jgi:DNA (cytosine-5)-methyltransferase 1